MRRLVLILLFSALAGVASAQARFGIKGGLNYSNFRAVDLHNGWDGATASSVGWNAGFFALFHLAGFGIQPEILYAEKGTEALEMKYLEFSLSVRFRLFCIPGVLSPFLLGGPYASYALDGEADEAIWGEGFSYKKWEYGAGIGLGCDVLNRISLTARYDWGLNKVAEGTPQINAKSRLLTLSVGLYL